MFSRVCLSIKLTKAKHKWCEKIPSFKSSFTSLLGKKKKKRWTSSDHLPPYCKSTNQLVPKRLTLRNGTQTSCRNFLCIQLEKTLV